MEDDTKDEPIYYKDGWNQQPFRLSGHEGNKEGRFKDGASQYFLGYQAEGGAIQGDGEYLKKSKFQQQKVGQMIKKAVQSEILEVPLEKYTQDLEKLPSLYYCQRRTH